MGEAVGVGGRLGEGGVGGVGGEGGVGGGGRRVSRLLEENRQSGREQRLCPAA